MIERKRVFIYFLILRKGNYQLEWGGGCAVEMNSLVIFVILTLDPGLSQGSNQN